MNYQDKSSLRNSYRGFLNQRLKVCKLVYEATLDPAQLLKAEKIQFMKTQLEMIIRWDYWRHCREVIIQEDLIREILPSDQGNHKVIRRHVLEMIEHCREIQKIPSNVYRERHRRDQAKMYSR